ncbi:hypothetical protein ACRAWD_09480 [Caulobacter segnis]
MLTNTSKEAVEGSAAWACRWCSTSIITDRSLEEAHAQASFVDP